MPKCFECGQDFDVDDARSEYQSQFRDFSYDADIGGDMCGGCAVCQTEGAMAKGRAIDMMNGEEDYDDDFVRDNL